MGVHNNANNPLNVTAIIGSLNNAQAFHQFYQNFSYQVGVPISYAVLRMLSVHVSFHPAVCSGVNLYVNWQEKKIKASLSRAALLRCNAELMLNGLCTLRCAATTSCCAAWGGGIAVLLLHARRELPSQGIPGVPTQL